MEKEATFKSDKKFFCQETLHGPSHERSYVTSHRFKMSPNLHKLLNMQCHEKDAKLL